jgi:hypothetical protein
VLADHAFEAPVDAPAPRPGRIAEPLPE